MLTMPTHTPLHVVVDVLSGMPRFSETVDTPRWELVGVDGASGSL